MIANLKEFHLGRPIRFLAVEWREDWEFDHPSLLVEPVVRYSPNGTPAEDMIGDAADIFTTLDRTNSGVILAADEDVSREFEWRGWSVAEIHQKAIAAAVRREAVKLGTGFVGVKEKWLTFALTPAGVEYVEVPRPEKCEHLSHIAEVDVNRITDKGGVRVVRFAADTRIRCAECGVAFRFIGLPAGLDMNGAAVSVDGTEGRFTIAPMGEVLSELEGTPVGFTVRKTK